MESTGSSDYSAFSGVFARERSTADYRLDYWNLIKSLLE